MTTEPGPDATDPAATDPDETGPDEDWSDITFRGYTQFPVVTDPEDLELPEPFATPADAEDKGAADDAG